MIGKVAEIASGSNYSDKQRRITLRFAGLFTEVRVPENMLGIIGLSLDDEVEISFHPVREQAKSEAA